MSLTRQQAAALVAELERQVKFNEWGDLINRDEVIEYATQKHGISKTSAYNHMRKAARRQRWLRRNEWKKP